MLTDWTSGVGLRRVFFSFITIVISNETLWAIQGMCYQNFYYLSLAHADVSSACCSAAQRTKGLEYRWRPACLICMSLIPSGGSYETYAWDLNHRFWGLNRRDTIVHMNYHSHGWDAEFEVIAVSGSIKTIPLTKGSSNASLYLILNCSDNENLEM